VARRPPERERVSLDCGRRKPQLKGNPLGGCRVPKISIDEIFADIIAGRITVEEAAQRILPFVGRTTLDVSKIPSGQRYRLHEVNLAVRRALLRNQPPHNPSADKGGSAAPNSGGTT
jgi:hypothetical protein